MRRKKTDDLLRQAVVLEAEEQGRLWEKEPSPGPVPEESQARFDAALGGAGSARQRTADAYQTPKKQQMTRTVPRRLLTVGLTAASCAALVLVAVLLIRANTLRSPEPENRPAAPVETQASVPAATETPAAAAAPTPEAGNRHWYTYTVLASGVVDSAGRNYLAMYGPHAVTMVDGVAIGRVKGIPTEVNMYTSDPEERVIWAYTDSFSGMFVLSGVELPEPDLTDGEIAFTGFSTDTVLSDKARSELLALLNGADPSQAPVDLSDPDSGTVLSYLFRDPEIPNLRYALPETVYRIGDRIMLIVWKTDSRSISTEPDYQIEIDPDSALYREYLAWEEQEIKNSAETAP